MQGMKMLLTAHLHGTLAANAQGCFLLTAPATLIEAQAVASNDSSAKLQVGLGSEADGLMTAQAIGQSSAPASWGRGDFDGALATDGECPHIAKGDLVTWLLDFDGASGTAAQNVDIVLTFLE
jgi:hypothetical protein